MALNSEEEKDSKAEENKEDTSTSDIEENKDEPIVVEEENKDEASTSDVEKTIDESKTTDDEKVLEENKDEASETKEEVKDSSTDDKKDKKEKTKGKKQETVEESEREKTRKKLKEEVKKNQEKREGKSRLLEYIKTEHKWENYVMIAVGIASLLVGVLILVGTLTPKSDFWVIGTYPKVVAWILVVGGAILILYGLWPIYKPSFPELKKITWLTGKKYWADVIRVFLFLIIFALLFLLYDTFIQEVLARIMGD